jgi:glycine/D-amino acid oxidase-like deaminating enzyme
MPHNWSFWERDLYFDDIDYLVIGAGIVGITTAIFLKRRKPDSKIVVIDKKFPGLGASTKNAGFACFGSISEILSDIEESGEETALHLLENRWVGLDMLKQLVPEQNMDLQYKGSHEMFFKDSTMEDKVLQAFPKVNQMASEALKEKNVFSMVNNDKLASLSDKAIYSRLEGQLNPVSMMTHLHRVASDIGVILAFGIEVSDIQNQKIISSTGQEIFAERLVLCNNGFASKLLELEDLKMVRNQVMITKPIKDNPLVGTYHMDQGYIYFREYMNRILIGGARNLRSKEETTGSFGDNPDILNYLEEFLKTHLVPIQKVEIDHHWSGILGVGSIKQPIIRKINPYLYAGIRLGGMGVAIGTFVGHKLSNIID